MRRIIIILIIITIFNINISADEHEAVDYYTLGKNAETEGDFFKAVEMYKSALIMNEKYFDAVCGLAHAYYGLDEFDESLKYALEAEKLDSGNTDLMNLKGRIFLNLGEFETARGIFSSVLQIEENNINAEFGLAELDIASGRISTAENRFRQVLLVSPESRKALLALVMINDNNGNMQAAEEYLKQALQYYSDNAFVRYTAAEHFFKSGNTEEALYHLKTALFLQPDFLDASILSAEINMEKSNYNESVLEIEKVIGNYESEPLLWYILGRSYENLKNTDKAVMSYARNIVIRPDDDLTRIALENEIIENTELDNPLRERYSDYHIDLGRKYEARNMLEKALNEYRRSLVINPYSIDARLLYADIFKRKGYIERYLLILSALVEEGFGNLDILDEIEIQKSMQDSTVSEKWNINQFSIEKEKNHISIFFSDYGMSHNEGEAIISKYVEYLLLGYENIYVDSNQINDNFAECFRISRENESDYFIIFKCTENERAVSLTAEIYLASTGSKLKTVRIVRTGNQMIPEAGRAVVNEVHNILPVYGRIINRKFDQIIVNLGKKDGLAEGSELLIIKKGELRKSQDSFNLEYDKSAVIGKYNVDQADELVSEGGITLSIFFDMINPGDFAFMPPETDDAEIKTEEETEQMFYIGDLFNSVANIP